MSLYTKSPVTLSKATLIAVLMFVLAPSANASIDNARETVVITLDQLYSKFQSITQTEADLQLAAIDIMRQDLLPRLDVQRFMKLILAKHWRKASREQRDAFSDVLQEFLLRSFAAALVGMQDKAAEYYDRIEVLPAKKGRKEGRAIVDAQIRHDQRTTVVSFRMNFTDEGWKVYDVIFEGVSFAINYRAILNSEIGKHGIDEVTRNLTDKLAN